MRNKSILKLIVPAVVLALLIAAFPSGPISAQRCVDSRGYPIACPEEQKKRPTVVYPTFTPTLTLTPVPTATKVPTKTSTVVPSATNTTSKPPAAVDRPGGAADFLWPAGLLLGVVGVVLIVWLSGGGGGGDSTFTAEAYGDLNVSEGPSTIELHGEINGDDSVDDSAGMFTEKEDE